MMKILVVLSIVCALSTVGQCQDMTSLMFQALGMDPPLLPPVMPQTLREHLYPIVRQQELLRQKQAQQQKQRYLSYLSTQQRRQGKANPYSTVSNPGTRYSPSALPQQRDNSVYSPSALPQQRDNSVFSPANMIRQPKAPNSVTTYKGNPYSISYQDGAARKGSYSNPYTVPRTASSRVATIRNGAGVSPIQMTPQAAKMLKTMQAMKVMREQPRRITDAKAAGCRLPVDNAAASVLMFGNCRNPTARMVCQAEFMTCMNVGVAAMCCPYGMNSLAMDTINYVNKLQHFVSELA